MAVSTSSKKITPAESLFLGIFICLALCFIYFSQSVNDSYSGLWTSSSAAEAAKKGILVQQLTISPRRVRYRNYQVEFLDAWVEQQTVQSHTLIFFKTVTKTGQQRLVLHYQGQRLVPARPGDTCPEPILSEEYKGSGQDLAAPAYSDQPLASTPHYLQTQPTARLLDGQDTLRFSIICDWQSKRDRSILIYRTDQ